MKRSLLFAFFILFSCQWVEAQNDSSLAVITLKNNTYYTGHIQNEDSTSVIFLTTENIKMEIPRAETQRFPQQP